MGKFRNLQQAYFWSADTDEGELVPKMLAQN